MSKTYTFECVNCGHKPNAAEVVEQGDCMECGDTIVSYTSDAAIDIDRLTKSNQKLWSANLKLKSGRDRLQAAAEHVLEFIDIEDWIKDALGDAIKVNKALDE